MTSLSALAENLTPRKTSNKRPTQQAVTDNDLDWSLTKTGSSKIETPHDSIECEIATIGTACPIEIGKPVAMADVAESSGLAGTGASGPADVAESSGPARTGAGGPVVDGTKFSQLLIGPEPVAREEARPIARS